MSRRCTCAEACWVALMESSKPAQPDDTAALDYFLATHRLDFVFVRQDNDS
jgi:hypothetical protein